MPMREITRPDGGRSPAYRAGDEGPGLVLIQEWWGLNAQIQSTAERLAEAGFQVLVPDLYRGRLAASGEEANHLMSGLDFVDACDQDIAGCVAVTILVVCVWANTVGALIPIGAQRLKVDPTVVSGPMITTLVDASGLFLYLTIAHVMVAQLRGH